jgi:5-methylcytosine-specific restriction endonuclease McrA
LNNSVLLLNADGQPLSILPLSTVSWQDAVKAVFQQKVRVIRSYDGVYLRSESLTIPCPSIIMLNTYHKQPKKAKYSRRNLYLRDNHCCQYCGDQFSYADLTIDHVIPKSHGGRLTWENTVSACGPCNVKKGDSLSRPINVPTVPSWHKINYSEKTHQITIPCPFWQDYIKWPEDKLILQS